MSVPIRPLVDRILGGTLTEYLSGLRGEGLSYEAIARRLDSDHDVTVSAEQVRRWCSEPSEGAA